MRAAPTIALILLAVAATARAETPQRPNILFIYTDDHSYRTVSCYPGADPWVKTPAIDKLAAEGMRFDSAYIGTWCMPSRATLLTGHHQFGVESMRMVGDYPGSEYDPAKCPFWPRTFREHGYVTAQIGKWHTGTDTGYGRDWDFQWVWNRPKYTETAGRYYYDQPVTIHGGETQTIARYSTDQYSDWACDFISGQDRDPDKPWYLWLCYGAVHGPYTPAERHLDDYPDAQITPPVDIYPPRPGKPDWAQRIETWKKGPDGQPVRNGKTLTESVRQYNQGVRAIDEGIARVMEALDKSGQRENTLVVFTSDQGFAWGQHGFTHKVAAYDSNIRSPLIISMPGRIPAGSVCSAPVSGVDLVPTFFHFAGIDPPWEMHGHDLSPLLANPKRDWSHPAMIVNTGHYFGSDTNVIPEGEEAYQNQVPWYVMLRVARYKYVRPLIPNDLEELYDLRADPDELDNLAVKPEHRELLHTFRKAAIAELQRTNAGFIAAMPPVRE